MKFVLALLLALAPGVHSQTHQPQLNLVAIDGYRAVSKEQVRELYSVASYYFRQLGIGFRVNFIDLNDHPCMYYNNYTVMLQELECFKAATPRRKKQVTYYMLPPWIIVNQAYGPQTALIGGIAERICGKVALGNATANGLRDGVELDTRMPHSAVILSHEIIHLACGTHQDHVPNLMHSNANTYTSAYGGILPVLRVTKLQVKRAYAKLRKIK